MKQSIALRMRRIKENTEKMIELGLVQPKKKTVKVKKVKPSIDISVRRSARLQNI